MNTYLIGAGLVNSVKPYCRKHVITSLDAHEFMFLNTLFISFFIICYLIYRKTSISDMYSKYSTLTLTQLISITILSLITVSGTFMRLSMDKNVETSTFANGLLIKGVTSAAVIFIGITFFNEKYTWKTWLAIILIATGIYLLN